MKNSLIYLMLVFVATMSLSVSAQTALRGDQEETTARLANPDSVAEGKDCPPCLEKMKLATKLNDDSRNREQIVNSALGLTGEAGRKGEGQTQ